MRRGEYDGAWRIADAVLRSRGRCPPGLPRDLQWLWDGTPLENRRVLIHCYHGLGDTIQFIRYAPLVHAVAREVIVCAQPPLLDLLSSAHGIDRLIPLHADAPDVEHDVDVEIMELPHVFRIPPDALPVCVPYLKAPVATLERDDRLQVGVVWQAGDWGRERSMTWTDIAPLFDVPGVAVHVLQRGPALNDVPAGWGIRSGSDDVVTTAQVVQALDLVVTVDSMPAHLAGALGRPVWTLLAANHDWRWLERGTTCPWYPSMWLYRQREAGDWGELVTRVAADLEARVRDTLGRAAVA